MKKLLLLTTLMVLCLVQGRAQSTAKYGTLHYDSLFRAMPEYVEMQKQIKLLREKYDSEANYNEMTFKRQFAEFLQGQKEFPQNILLKRQRDLQESMEKSIAFREDADSLLRQAAEEMKRPITQLLNQAIQAVGAERGYECMVNLDTPSYLYLNPAFTEDATPFVVKKVAELRNAALTNLQGD